MKALILIFTLLFVSITSAQVPSLKDVMKEMEVPFKSIAQSLQSGEINLSDVDSVEQLQSISARAALIEPITADTDAQKLRYSKLSALLIQKLLLLEEKMEAALSSDATELSEVRNLFFEINDLRKESHDEFKFD